MNDEHNKLLPPEGTRGDHTSRSESEGIRVYERPERRPVPAWAWIALLLAFAVIGWFILQALQ